MDRRLLPPARRNRDGHLPWNPLRWYARGEHERLQVIDELLHLLGTDNPNSYIHRESSPADANDRLHLSLSILPLDFARRVLTYAKSATQHERDTLQTTLRYVRGAREFRPVLNSSEVTRTELYLAGLPVFEALFGTDCGDLGSEMINHAEVTGWEAQKAPGATTYPNAYFLYTILWPNARYASYSTLAWLDEHALKLARFKDVLSARETFDRDFCELLLESAVPVISSGAL